MKGLQARKGGKDSSRKQSSESLAHIGLVSELQSSTQPSYMVPCCLLS